MTEIDILTNKILQDIKQNRLQTSCSEKDSKCSHGCDDNGFIWGVDEKGNDIAKECSCRKERILNNRLSFANLPEAFKEMSIDNFDISAYKRPESKKVIDIALKVIGAYMDNLEGCKAQGKGLYIYSEEKGSGKTRMGASIANELMKKHDMRVKFATSTNIVNEIKATWDKENRTYTESKLLNDLSTTEVLIIDDFGTEQIRDWINDKFYSIINERYNGKKITIYTSNYSLSNLPYDSRIKSRVKETTFDIQFPEESVRDHIAEQDNIALIRSLRR